MTEQTCVSDEQTHFGGDRIELIMPARESMLMLTRITLSVKGLEPTMQAQRLESMRRCEEVALCILESMVDSVDIQKGGGVIEGFTLIRHIA